MGILGALLDRSVVFSFDRSGYERHAKSFTALPEDLTGKRYLVTGANSGLGFATARGLAKRHAAVVMLCRSEARGVAARRRILDEAPASDVHLEIADMSYLASIDAFAARMGEAPLDGIIHNAGVLLDSHEVSLEGHEMTYATNLLGSFRLTHLLASRLRPGSRLVFVSSGGMYGSSLDVAELVDPAEPFDGVRAYAQTKRGQVVLARMLAERLEGVHVSAMHPGWADTTGVQTSLPSFYERMKGRLRSAEQGADTVLWLATSEEARGSEGRFYFDRSVAKTRLWFRSEPERAECLALWERLCVDARVEAFGDTDRLNARVSLGR